MCACKSHYYTYHIGQFNSSSSESLSSSGRGGTSMTCLNSLTCFLERKTNRGEGGRRDSTTISVAATLQCLYISAKVSFTTYKQKWWPAPLMAVIRRGIPRSPFVFSFVYPCHFLCLFPRHWHLLAAQVRPDCLVVETKERSREGCFLSSPVYQSGLTCAWVWTPPPL
mgnify:CR=1 FL=1